MVMGTDPEEKSATEKVPRGIGSGDLVEIPVQSQRIYLRHLEAGPESPGAPSSFKRNSLQTNKRFYKGDRAP